MTKNARRAQIVGTGLIGGSIALALRFDTQIFAQDELLDLSSDFRIEKSNSSDEALPDVLTSLGPNELEEHLRRLNPEDFGRFIP